MTLEQVEAFVVKVRALHRGLDEMAATLEGNDLGEETELRQISEAVSATIQRWAVELVGEPSESVAEQTDEWAELQRAATTVRDWLVAGLNCAEVNGIGVDFSQAETGSMVNLLAQAIDALELEG